MPISTHMSLNKALTANNNGNPTPTIRRPDSGAKDAKPHDLSALRSASTADKDRAFYQAFYGQRPESSTAYESIGQRLDAADDRGFAQSSNGAGNLLEAPTSDDDSYDPSDSDPGTSSSGSYSNAVNPPGSRDPVPPRKLLHRGKEYIQQPSTEFQDQGFAGDTESTDDEGLGRQSAKRTTKSKRHPLRVESEKEIPSTATRRNSQNGDEVENTSKESPENAPPSSTSFQSRILASSSSNPVHMAANSSSDEDSSSDLGATGRPVLQKRQAPSRKVYRTIYSQEFPNDGLPANCVVLPKGLSEICQLIRHADRNDEEIRLFRANNQAAWQALPDAARRAFAGAQSSLLDDEVWIWIGPRIYHYSQLPLGTARQVYCELIVQELFEVFKDLHPNHFRFLTEAAEFVYQKKIRTFVHRRTNTMVRHLRREGFLVIEKTPTDAGWKLVRNLLFGTKQRPHDLWAQYSDKAAQLREDYPAYLKAVGGHPTSPATLQTYRRTKFEEESGAEQEVWVGRALQLGRQPEVPEPEKVAALLLPAIKRLLLFYAKHSGNPVLFGSGCESRTTPGTADMIMLYLGGRAPSRVKDFLASEGAHGRFVGAAWRQQLAEVFDIDWTGISMKIDETQASDSAPAPKRIPPPVPTLPYPKFDHSVRQLADPKEQTVLTQKEAGKLMTALHEWFRGFYTIATSKKRIDYGRIERAPEKYYHRSRLPVVGGTPVRFTNPKHLLDWELVAWANHVSNKSLPEDQRFAFIGEAARIAFRDEDMPSFIRLGVSGNAGDGHSEVAPTLPIMPQTSSSSPTTEHQPLPHGEPVQTSAISNIGPSPDADDSEPRADDLLSQDQPMVPVDDAESIPMDFEWERSSGVTQSQTVLESEADGTPTTAVSAGTDKGKGKEVPRYHLHPKASFAFVPKDAAQTPEPDLEKVLMHVKPLPLPPSAYGLAPVVAPNNFSGVCRQLFGVFSYLPHAPILVLHHTDWKPDDSAFWTHLNGIVDPIPLVLNLTATRKVVLDDLVARIGGFISQLRTSLDTPGSRRPSFHVATVLVARYLLCATTVAKTRRKLSTDQGAEVEFKLYSETLARKANELAQIAFAGAAFFFYDNIVALTAHPGPDPQDVLPLGATELIAAWAASLREYPVPLEDIPAVIWGDAPGPSDGCPQFPAPFPPAAVFYKSSLESLVDELLSSTSRPLNRMPLAEQSRAVASIVVCLKQRVATGDRGEVLADWTLKLDRLISHLRNPGGTAKKTGHQALPNVLSSHLRLARPVLLPNDGHSRSMPPPEPSGVVRPQQQLRMKIKSAGRDDWRLNDIARVRIDGASILVKFVQENHGFAIMRSLEKGDGDVIKAVDGSPVDPVPFRADWLINPVRSPFPPIRRQATLLSGGDILAEQGGGNSDHSSKRHEDADAVSPGPQAVRPRDDRPPSRRVGELKMPMKRPLPSDPKSPSPTKRPRGLNANPVTPSPRLDRMAGRNSGKAASRSSRAGAAGASDGLDGAVQGADGGEEEGVRPRRVQPNGAKLPDGSLWNPKIIGEQLQGTKTTRTKKRRGGKT